MELRWHHWLVALTIAAALHAVVLARVNWTRAETAPVLRQDPMMVAIEAGHEADELAEFAAPPSVIRETAPGDAPAAAEPDPVPVDASAPKPLEFQPPRPVPGLAPNAPVAAVSPEYVDTAPRPAESADTVAPESPGPVTTAPPEAVAGFGPEVAPAAAVTLASESVARTAEQVMALPDAIAMDPAPDAGLAESVALPKATLFPEVMSDPGPEAASTAALGPGAATDVRALVPSTVLMSEHAHSVARLDANLPDPWESAHASEVTAAITAEAVDLELTPIVPIIEVRPPESPATGTVESPLESRPQPVPELAAVAPRDTVTARTAMPRLKQRDVEIREIVADYAAVLKTWVGRHMSYPVHARLNGIEGTAVVRLVMSRDGRILSYQLERTSGHMELDQEAIRTIRRASPFPPLPPEMDHIELTLRLPLVFSVKNFEARRTVPPIYLE